MPMPWSWSKCVLLVGLAAVSLFRTPDAQAQSAGGSSRIVSEWSTGDGRARCIEVAEEYILLSELVVQPCHDGSNQRFRLLDNNLDNTRIAVYSGNKERCLFLAPDDQVYATLCDPLFAELARWKVRGDGKLQLLLPPDLAYDDDVCLSTKIANAARVYGCRFNDSEIFGTNWRVPPASGSPLMVGSLQHGGQCLDVWGGQRAANTPLIRYACSGARPNQAAANQVFETRHPVGGASAGVITVYKGDEMLCVEGSLGGKIQAVPCNPFRASQQWLVTGSPNANAGATGFDFVLTNQLWVNGKRCLDSSMSSQEALAWACHGGANQKWVFRF